MEEQEIFIIDNDAIKELFKFSGPFEWGHLEEDSLVIHVANMNLRAVTFPRD